MKNANRFSNAEVRIHAEEYKIFCELRKKGHSWRETSTNAEAILKQILCTFAVAAGL